MELLVVSTVIGILVALILPAVQSGREAARRIQCSNHLKQVSLAAHAYHDTWNSLPLGEAPGGVSPNVSILPFIEQRQLYDSFNFNLPDPKNPSRTYDFIWLAPESVTSSSSRLIVYTCPSEIHTSNHPEFGSWAASYAWNGGSWWPIARRWDGLFGRSMVNNWQSPRPTFDNLIDPPLGAIGFSACLDGLSSTLMLAEVANGPLVPGAPRSRVSDCYMIPPLTLRSSARETLDACDAIDWSSGTIPWGGRWRYKGYSWAEGTMWRTWFNTIRPPNRTCCADGRGTVVQWWWIMKPASSYHPGIVQAAMADGSVKSFKETIDRNIWLGLGTRAGGEVVSGDSL